MPFCTERCRLVDLRRWLSEEYAVPVIRSDDDPVECDEAGDEL